MMGKKLLLVDDEVEIVKIVDEFMTMQGFDVLSCTNAYDAIKVIDSRDDIDLVILDRRMPGKDGLSVLEHITSVGKIMPAIVMSGSFNAEKTRAVLTKMEFEDFDILIKPVDLFVLLEIVKKMLK